MFQLRSPSENTPLGRFAFAFSSTARTSSRFRFRLFSFAGLISIRTPGSELPPTNTLPTPFTCDSFCCKMLAAASYICPADIVSDVSPSIRIGASAGFTLRHVGFLGRFAGNCPRAALIAACTSRAAASMFRFKSNWSVMLVEPSVLDEVISFTPAIRPNCLSSGVATDDAIVSGLAPGRLAFTEIDGKSTCGSGATGRNPYATTPEIPSATVNNVVATGLWINGVEIINCGLSSGYHVNSETNLPIGESLDCAPIVYFHHLIRIRLPRPDYAAPPLGLSRTSRAHLRRTRPPRLHDSSSPRNRRTPQRHSRKLRRSRPHGLGGSLLGKRYFVNSHILERIALESSQHRIPE